MLVFRRVVDLAKVETPEVAALIEDQTEVLEDAPNVEDVKDEIAAVAETDAPFEEEANVESSDAPAETEMSLDAKDPVSETLKAPFAFPWNKRRAAGTPSNDGQPQLPAE